MKKLIVALMVLGFIFALVSSYSDAATTRTINRKFRAFAANTAVAQSAVIYRITGVATGSNSVFGIYNVGTLGGTAVTVCAVEGGEATSGDALPMYDFGEDGLVLNSGMTVVVSGCTIVVEYI